MRYAEGSLPKHLQLCCGLLLIHTWARTGLLGAMTAGSWRTNYLASSPLTWETWVSSLQHPEASARLSLRVHLHWLLSSPCLPPLFPPHAWGHLLGEAEKHTLSPIKDIHTLIPRICQMSPHMAKAVCAEAFKLRTWGLGDYPGGP